MASFSRARRIGQQSKHIAPFIREQFLHAIGSELPLIEKIAAENITVVGSERVDQTEEWIALHTAASFVSSSRILGYQPTDDEAIRVFLMRTDRKIANCSERDVLTYDIRISRGYSSPISLFVDALGSETRHAVHYALGSAFENRDRKIEYLETVLSEVIDDAYVLDPTQLPELDPFINDFYGFCDDPHVAAGHFLPLLSIDQTKEQQQIFWLARQPIRPSLASPEIDDALDRYRKRRSEVHRLEYPRLCQYHYPHETVWDYYNCSSSNEPQLDGVRRDLRDLAPYVVSRLLGVPFGKKVVTRFASQLDYVALKLMTVKPMDLFLEAKMMYPEGYRQYLPC